MSTNPLRLHWFFLIAPLVLTADLYVGLSARGQIDHLTEAGLLFDLVVLIPGVYWLCYRQRGKRAVIKAAALACFGIWAALKLVPEPERDLLNYVAPLRYAGLAALAWLELVVALAIYRTVFKSGSVDEAISRAPTDMPPWVVRLLAIEANLWRRAWILIKRLIGKR
jgi:hypothetical protein